MTPRSRGPRRRPLDPARRAAFETLRAVSARDAYANLVLPALLAQRGIGGRDAAFATELTYGTCRARGLLDAVIGAAAERSPQAIDPVLLDLLRLGTYQLLRTRVDAHAAVSTTVEQAGIEFDSARAGFATVYYERSPAETSGPGLANSLLMRRTIRSGMPRSCMRIPDGSPRPLLTRWARRSGSSRQFWPATTNGQRCTWRHAPGC